MVDFANFDRLKDRLRLSGRIETVTGLHIGAGNGEIGASDLPVLRDARGYPMIPGGSLKGVLRSTIESMLRTVDRGRWWACSPFAKARAEGPGQDGYCGHHDTERRSDVKTVNACAACRLFGNSVLASHVRITDAIIRGDLGERPPIELRDGVAIDRDYQVVAGAQKYLFEVVPPGVTFDFEVFVDNPAEAEMGLLFAGFDQIDEGFTALGGFSSRGLGRVRVHWTKLHRLEAKHFFLGTPSEPARLDEERSKFRTKLSEEITAAR